MVYFVTSLALTNYSLPSISLYNISPIAINVIDIKTLSITIGTVYTNLINLDQVLLADIRRIPYSYGGRLNIGKLYYRATLSLIRLSSALELIKHLALLSPICASTFRHYL
jgi:hypothetical protein